MISPRNGTTGTADGTRTSPHGSETGTTVRRDDSVAIRQLSAEWLRAERGRDLGKLMTLVTDDVVFLRPHADALEGRQAVEDFYRQVFSGFALEHTSHPRELRINGDWAFQLSDEEYTLTPLGDGATFHFTGNGMSIIRRGTDGAWRFARAITNALPHRT